MWNDTDVPQAYLVTFRTYGTWLHGDARGSVDRENNIYGMRRIAHTPARKDHVRSLLNREPVFLDGARRSSVENAIRETCAIRNWDLLAVNIRTSHAHIVVTIGNGKPETALNAFKANATRRMREDGCWQSGSTPWVEKGSRRYLWNERSVARAIDYVLYGQGDELPDFDD